MARTFASKRHAAEQLVIRLAREDEAGAGEGEILRVTWQKRASTRRREILVPTDATPGTFCGDRQATRHSAKSAYLARLPGNLR